MAGIHTYPQQEYMELITQMLVLELVRMMQLKRHQYLKKKIILHCYSQTCNSQWNTCKTKTADMVTLTPQHADIFIKSLFAY